MTDPETLDVYASSVESYRLRWHSLSVPKELVAFAGAVDTSSPVLDVGCGTGRDLAALDALGVPAVGVDVVPEMLSAAAEVFSGPLVVADACRMPFAPGSFSGVWSSAGLVHLDAAGVSTALSEFARVLQSGAPLVVSLKHREGLFAPGSSGRDGAGRWFWFWYPKELRDCAAAAGFDGRVRLQADATRPETVWCLLEAHRR